MNIYSNAIYHRTREVAAIEGILKEGFKAFYCGEEVYAGAQQPPGVIGIPMISFCDIPLVHVCNNNYGKYGIALTRRWAKLKHLEPVLYYPIDIKCQSTKMIIRAYENFLNNRNDVDSYRILGYAKPYKKINAKKGQNKDNYVEREWRKVYANPSPCKWFTEGELKAYRGDKESTPKPSVSNSVTFGVNDIVFIIVEKDKAARFREFIVEQLSDLCGQYKLTKEDKYILLSKILIYEDLCHNL